MKKYLYLLLGFIFFNIYSIAQEKKYPQIDGGLKPLSVKDSILLSNLPELKLPEKYKGPDAPLLPPVVDNSQEIYWRPVFSQVGFECGQASGIGQNFTYEINSRRDLPSDIPDNQYPTHFCWNFGNGGDGYYGVSYFHSFQIVKTCGTPNVTDYGGSMSYGGPRRWMSGYNEYYNGMHNRISSVYAIYGQTEEGILTLKHWINDHLNGSDVGGVASFYASCPYGMETLPPGTPEEGKYVMTQWDSYANHALAIAGYNDSIRWDFNNDGQYTNDIDINNDGIVDVRDWEIGGLKFSNNYSGGPNWGNEGFCYMMYKALGDPMSNGGIWNHAAHVLYSKETCSPQLTMRVILKHDRRSRIRVTTGISSDTSDTEPSYVLDFPIFNYQGGPYYMQGGSSEEDKIIEFGLDITPLLNKINSGQIAKFFLLVDENDPETYCSGEIIHYSIIDYTNGVNEIFYDETNVPLNNNDLTTLPIIHTINYNDVSIDTDELPPATVFEPYNFQLTASGGS
ncbi:MAG: hypothetical protein K8R58_00070, partial [Bacteroidales bacterium]|nr:hypothetical protein [Bacteroidales bacterium]